MTWIYQQKVITFNLTKNKKCLRLQTKIVYICLIYILKLFGFLYFSVSFLSF